MAKTLEFNEKEKIAKTIPHLKASCIGKYTQLTCENCFAVTSSDKDGKEFVKWATKFRDKHKDCKK